MPRDSSLLVVKAAKNQFGRAATCLATCMVDSSPPPPQTVVMRAPTHFKAAQKVKETLGKWREKILTCGAARPPAGQMRAVWTPSAVGEMAMRAAAFR
jgi:hypothetical protein